MAAWIAEPIDFAPPAAEEIIRRTVAAIRTGRDPAGFVGRQREVVLRRMHTLTTPGKGQGDPASVLVREHAPAHLDADLRWLDIASRRGRHVPVRSRRSASSGVRSGRYGHDTSCCRSCYFRCSWRVRP